MSYCLSHHADSVLIQQCHLVVPTGARAARGGRWSKREGINNTAAGFYLFNRLHYLT